MDRFNVTSLPSNYDFILGMPWLARHKPNIRWSAPQTINIQYSRRTHHTAAASLAARTDAETAAPPALLANVSAAAR